MEKYISPYCIEKIDEDTYIPIVIVIDKNKKIIFVNSESEKVLGYKSNELLGRTLHDLVTSDLKNAFESSKHFSGRFGVISISKKNGKLCRLNSFFISENDEKGNSLNDLIFGIYHKKSSVKKNKSIKDINLENNNLNFHKFSHDTNNILTSIEGYAQLALLFLSKTSKEQKYLKQVLEGCQRLEALLKHVFDKYY